MTTRLKRWLTSWLPPLVLFLLVVGAWEGITTLAHVPPYLVPSPSQVFLRAWASAPELAAATLRTATAAMAGLALSLAVGVPTGIVFSQSALIRRSVFPYAILLQTVPSVALAPLVVLWFGHGMASVVVVAFVISLFPIITNSTAGLLAVDPNLLELFAMSNATRWQVLCKLRLPNSIRSVITGVKISAGLSVIGAIVGEFSAGYGSDRYGLGYLIVEKSDNLKTDYLFAAVLAAMFLGVAIFGAVSYLGDCVLAWWHLEPESARLTLSEPK